jgi:glycosyltransferase involved in cell wall biosynthesis
MENILSESSIHNEEKRIVQVLLATYNGARYLDDFLQSLANQKQVKINLNVCDDGSTDKSIKILRKYEDNFNFVQVVHSPGIGPAENFFSLINQVRGDFIALADQDDIWESSHLINSIKRLEEYTQSPALSVSQVYEFGENQRYRIFPKKIKNGSFLNLVFENQFRGCTMVFNKAALDLINTYRPKNAIMHDWWIGMLISFCGKTIWGTDPEILYRVHDSNAVGRSKPLKIRLVRYLENLKQNDTWKPLEQIYELYENFAPRFQPEPASQLKYFILHTQSLHTAKKLKIVFLLTRFRTRILDEIAIRVLLFWKT